MHSHVQELQESAQGVIGRRRCALRFDNIFTLQITFLASHIPHLMAANMPDTHTGVYASQTRDDFSADDVEHYFNYMGMLATEVSSRGNDWDI